MNPTKYPQYTSKWTSVIKDWSNPITPEQYEWIRKHEGGEYHIHRSGTAIKFERKEDAAWFVLRF